MGGYKSKHVGEIVSHPFFGVGFPIQLWEILKTEGVYGTGETTQTRALATHGGREEENLGIS